MSALYSEAFNHEATVLCDSVWDADNEVVCSTVYQKGRGGKATVSVCPYYLPSAFCHLFILSVFESEERIVPLHSV